MSAPLSRLTPHSPLSSLDTTLASASQRPPPAPLTAVCQPERGRPRSSASATGAPSAWTTSSRWKAVPSRSRRGHTPAPTLGHGSRSASTWTAAPPCTTRDASSPVRARYSLTSAPSGAEPSASNQRRPLPATPPRRDLSAPSLPNQPQITLGDDPLSQPSGHFHRTLSGQNLRPATGAGEPGVMLVTLTGTGSAPPLRTALTTASSSSV